MLVDPLSLVADGKFTFLFHFPPATDSSGWRFPDVGLPSTSRLGYSRTITDLTDCVLTVRSPSYAFHHPLTHLRETSYITNTFSILNATSACNKATKVTVVVYKLVVLNIMSILSIYLYSGSTLFESWPGLRLS